MPLSAPLKETPWSHMNDVVEHIRNVIRDTSTPSWFVKAPPNFGDSTAGTLKADEWRSLITVYIPIALISLWGLPDSGTIQTNLKTILDHTMLLMSAVNLCCARTMSSMRAEAYQSCIASYIRDLPCIHPTFNLRPNHHAAIHIYDFLKLFGPVNSWWTFPFERLIGVLQRLPKNHKSGQFSTNARHVSAHRPYR